MQGTVSHTALLAGQQLESSDSRYRERRIPSSAVRELCGGVSDMTLWRWLNDPDLGFPKPIYIGRRRYWRESDVLTWLDAQVAKAVA